MRRPLITLAVVVPMLAALPAAAQPDRDKLRALDEAYRAGVLDEEEYQAKRRVLTAAKPKPAPSPSPATPVPTGGAVKATPPPAGVVRMRLVRVIDKTGFGQPVEAVRLLIPADWQFEDQVNWDNNQLGCPPNVVQVRFRATAPDGVTGLEYFPTYSWTWTDDPMMQSIQQQQAANRTGCAPYPVMKAADFVRELVVPALRQGARAGAVEPLSSVSQTEQRIAEQNNRQLIQGGYVRGVRVDAARVRLEYDLGGRPVEEWMSATVTARAMPAANSADLMQGNLNYNANTYSVGAYNVFGVRAPKGRLDANASLFASMVASVRVNPQYQAALTQFILNINKINMQGARDRQRIWQEANASIQSTWRETQRIQQESQARQAEQFGQAIRGVENYVDPSTNERIELSSGYRNAWTNGKGEYLLSDTPGFDPAVTYREDWRALRREQR